MLNIISHQGNTNQNHNEIQQVVLGKLDIKIQKNEVGPLPYTMYKNKLKMEQRPKYKSYR